MRQTLDSLCSCLAAQQVPKPGLTHLVPDWGEAQGEYQRCHLQPEPWEHVRDPGAGQECTGWRHVLRHHHCHHQRYCYSVLWEGGGNYRIYLAEILLRYSDGNSTQKCSCFSAGVWDIKILSSCMSHAYHMNTIQVSMPIYLHPKKIYVHIHTYVNR